MYDEYYLLLLLLYNIRLPKHTGLINTTERLSVNSTGSIYNTQDVAAAAGTE